MHFTNYVDSWCKANSNPYDRTDLDGVSIQVLLNSFVHKNHFICIDLIHIYHIIMGYSILVKILN